MIIVTERSNDDFVVEAQARQPTVYLDLDSLGDIARTDRRRERFLEVLKTKGTLLVSWTHALDLSGPQGANLAKIQAFLDGVGVHWLPLELSPWKVARKESGDEPSNGTPCVSESLLEAYYPHIHGDPLTLARLIDLIHQDRQRVQDALTALKASTAQMVQEWRTEFRADNTVLDRILPEIDDPGRPSASFLSKLSRLVTMRTIGANSFVWTPNDGIDFAHAAVAAPCADFLLLDRQWKSRVEAVAPARGYRWLFYRAEIDEFLTALEGAVVGAR